MLWSAVQDIDGVDDAAEFSEVMAALSDIGVQQQEIDTLLRTLSGILWLGNLKIEAVHANDSSRIKADAALTNSAELLRLSEQDLSHAITHKKVRQGPRGPWGSGKGVWSCRQALRSSSSRRLDVAEDCGSCAGSVSTDDTDHFAAAFIVCNVAKLVLACVGKLMVVCTCACTYVCGCSHVWLFLLLCLQIKTRDELIIKPLTAQEAGDARDALAKALYSGEGGHRLAGKVCLAL